MKMRMSILLLAACFCLCGCQREPKIPRDSLRLTVQEVTSDSDVQVSLLTIRLSRDASISVDGEGFHNHVRLPDARDDGERRGEVLLSAVRVAPGQDKRAYIQTLIRPRAGSAFAGGTNVHPVPTNTTLASFFSISVTGGIYRLDAPVTIAQMQGKPVTLVVGRPTK